MLKASLSENEKLKTKATDSSHLLQEKVSHLTEREEENEKLKEIKELLEEQLVLFQSEKEEFIQERSLLETIEIQKRDEEIRLLKIQLASYQKEKESEKESFVEEIKKLQSATDKNERDKIVQGLLSQNGKLKGKLSVADKMTEQLQKELKQEQASLAESKKEIELLQEKITAMNLKQIERNKQVQEKEEILMLKIENLMRSKDNLVFEDDIYGDIVIDNPLILKIIKTRQFQRLKNIKKLGYIFQNIQKSTYSRLQHSIGMYCLAGEYVKQFQRKQPELNITESDVLCVQIAALCFNLGHGPFSHIFGLFLKEVFPNENKPWEKVSEASVMMFDYMIEENDEVKNLLKEFLDNYEEDIAFIKELIHGTLAYKEKKGKRKGKEFLHEIVVNKRSGFDVCMIDYTIHDAAVLGMNISFQWRVFLSKAVVMKCENDERHIFFPQDDLETYNNLFKTHYNLHRELYYLRKNRIVAVIIKGILVKSNKKSIIRDGDRLVTMSEATRSMSAFTQLDDSVFTSHDDDPEVQALLKCLDSKQSIGQIGFVVSTSDWHKERIKEHIIQKTKSCNIADQLVIDPIKNGYKNHESLTQYYYTSDGSTGQWTHEWAKPPPTAYPTPLRIFLVSGDIKLIHEVQKVLRELQANERLNGDTYSDKDNYNLMPVMPPLKTAEAKALEAQNNDK
ncbi:PREDICTED: deoxynucleoside triphosphate triphosphohydrolase SAMHD1-like [Amphimedon queenslandica]|uniref:HD domain-containing protein n=1 Tax=Amphimedon queenslandica TaxID=400682 RepID=A0AAN0JM38_AMPQE|nr:PREDICTED: deoxynucleoside triphosphate triphosphohydrolase SAMHD1-like [Amphimedon queenslandica]|eukprot:XP_019858065.1 PREDICTED: deoxynucleoside triphosphate triphosphohydrolase SAMHD1-like [Amphimedon queenslandica]